MQVKFVLVLAILFRFSNSEINNFDSDSIVFPEDSMRYEKSPCTTSDGKNGVCENAENCPRKRFKLTVEDVCFFERNDVFYCCSDVAVDDVPIPSFIEKTAEKSPVLGNLMTGIESSSTDDPITTNDTQTTTEFDLSIFDDLLASLESDRPAINACSRHRPMLSEIAFVGGSMAFEDEHPYMTAIGWTDSIGTIDWNCGGVVISSRFVLTAAHCTMNNGKSPDIVRVGDINLLVQNDTKIQPQDFPVRAITNHPEYDSLTFYNDIAVIEIDGEFNMTTPACLWINETIPSSEALAMGYGTRAFAGPRSNILYQGNLTLISNEECAARTQSSDLPRGILPNQICAHDPLQELDTCQGDSGGPLLIYTGLRANTKPQIIGITSFGAFCAGSSPGVYTRVSSYLEWIEKVALTDYEPKQTSGTFGI